MSILLKSISDSDTTLMFSEAANFPAASGVILIDAEEIIYSTNWMGTLYGCTRGANSTTATSHAAGAVITITDFFTATAMSAGASTSLNNLASVAINTALIPVTDNTIDLGSGSIEFRNVFVGSNLVLGNLEQISYNLSAGAMQWSIGDVFCTGGLFFYTDPTEATGPYIYVQTGPDEIVMGTNDLSNQQSLVLDNNTNANETPLLLWDITAATLQRVSIGVADSGGTGFRVLRIPN